MTTPSALAASMGGVSAPALINQLLGTHKIAFIYNGVTRLPTSEVGEGGLTTVGASVVEIAIGTPGSDFTADGIFLSATPTILDLDPYSTFVNPAADLKVVLANAASVTLASGIIPAEWIGTALAADTQRVAISDSGTGTASVGYPPDIAVTNPYLWEVLTHIGYPQSNTAVYDSTYVVWLGASVTYIGQIGASPSDFSWATQGSLPGGATGASPGYVGLGLAICDDGTCVALGGWSASVASVGPNNPNVLCSLVQATGLLSPWIVQTTGAGPFTDSATASYGPTTAQISVCADGQTVYAAFLNQVAISSANPAEIWSTTASAGTTGGWSMIGYLPTVFQGPFTQPYFFSIEVVGGYLVCAGVSANEPDIVAFIAEIYPSGGFGTWYQLPTTMTSDSVPTSDVMSVDLIEISSSTIGLVYTTLAASVTDTTILTLAIGSEGDVAPQWITGTTYDLICYAFGLLLPGTTTPAIVLLAPNQTIDGEAGWRSELVNVVAAPLVFLPIKPTAISVSAGPYTLSITSSEATEFASTDLVTIHDVPVAWLKERMATPTSPLIGVVIDDGAAITWIASDMLKRPISIAEAVI